MQAAERSLSSSQTVELSSRKRHEGRLTTLAAEAAELGKRIRILGTARLFAALTALVLVGGALLAGWGSGAALSALGVAAAFFALVAWHARMHKAADRLTAAARYHRIAIDRLDGRFGDSPSTGARFIDSEHPYADDLDIFGPRSLFQLLDFTHTQAGEARLASWLSSPSSLADIRERQEAVRELSKMRDFRERLATEGLLLSTERPDTEPLLEWVEAPQTRLFAKAFTPLLWLLPSLVLGLFLFARLGFLGESPWIISAIAVGMLGLSRLPQIEPIASAVSSKERSLDGYRALLECIESETFEASRLRSLRDSLGQAESSASREIARLSTIVGFFEARRNEVFRFFIGPALLWDWHCVSALERWRARNSERVRGFLDALGELEALASLAAYADDRDYAFPRIVEEPTFEARALGHPLLPTDRCIQNDVRLDGPGTALLITGSNMSGKSTLMRAIGTNIVLAMAGAPVCAESLVLSPVELRTSMRIRDSLEEGISHFYAELLKLKRVLEGLHEPRPLLFLLDEILHGTNSRERGIGARTVLRHLLQEGAMGAVSTHDLGLVDMDSDDEFDAKLRKVHFAEQVENGKMSFDYRLRPGVVRSSNALRLMQIVGIDVDIEEASSA